MDQGHGKVNEERFVFMTFDEVIDIITKHIGSVFTLEVFSIPAMLDEIRVGVAGFSAIDLPEAVFIESGVIGMGSGTAQFFWGGTAAV